MSRTVDCDVLIIGLGPTGTVLAGLLAAHGCRVIAIDREAAIFPLPRAAAFDQEVMRIFQMLGAAEAIEPHCRVPTTYRFETARGEVLLEFPTPQVVGQWGWMPTYFLHQPAVEAALRARVADLGADLRPATRLLDAAQDGDSVAARLDGPDGHYDVCARFLVGCDGASSPVRAAIGGGIDDYGFEEPWLVVDAIVPDGDDLPQYAMQICDPERPTTFLRMAGDRYRWEFMLKPGEDPETLASDENLARLLGKWRVLGRATLDRRAVYRFHGLVAERWRDRRLLIAGDAAHQMPPFAGQGMCSGIRDAANLAWKLAAVVRGRADDALLDTYQIEREPHVRAIIATAIAMGRTVCVLDPAIAAARDAGMLARKASGAQDVALNFPSLAGGCLAATPGAGDLFVQPIADGRRLDDVLGPGAWLIGRGTTPIADGRAFDLDAAELAPFAPALRACLDAHAAPAVLVRPDRHVFGTGAALDLARAWQAALRAPVPVPA